MTIRDWIAAVLALCGAGVLIMRPRPLLAGSRQRARSWLAGITGRFRDRKAFWPDGADDDGYFRDMGDDETARRHYQPRHVPERIRVDLPSAQPRTRPLPDGDPKPPWEVPVNIPVVMKEAPAPAPVQEPDPRLDTTPHAWDPGSLSAPPPLVRKVQQVVDAGDLDAYLRSLYKQD